MEDLRETDHSTEVFNPGLVEEVSTILSQTIEKGGMG
jgi:hypothetical protein